MSFVPNPLVGANQEALQNAMQTDQQARQQVTDTSQRIATSAQSVTKQLQQLAQKATASGGQSNEAGQMPGPSKEYLGLLSMAHNYHETQQAVAQQRLSEMDQQMRAGWMPDPKQMIKLVKKSGLNVDTTPEGIRLATNYYNQYYGEKDPVTQESRGETPKEISQMMEKAQNGTLGKKDVAQFVLGGMVRHEMRSARYAALDDQQKQALEQRNAKLMDTATDDRQPHDQRMNALGNLAIMNPTTVGQMTKHWFDFAAATPEQRKDQISIASGMMSPAEIAQRADRLTETYMQAGLGPEQARDVANSIANNKPLTATQIAAMPKITPENVERTTMAMKALADVGVPGNMLSGAVTSYMAGGAQALKGYLPSQTPQQIQEQMNQKLLGIEQQKLNLEQQRVSIDSRRATAEIANLQSEADERKAMVDYREAMAKKYGFDPDSAQAKMLMDGIRFFASEKNPDAGMKALQGQMEDTFAQILGGSLKRDKGWFGRAVTSFQADPGLVSHDVTGQPQKGTPQAAMTQQQDSPNKSIIAQSLSNIVSSASKAADAASKGVKNSDVTNMPILSGLPGLP